MVSSFPVCGGSIPGWNNRQNADLTWPHIFIGIDWGFTPDVNATRMIQKHIWVVMRTQSDNTLQTVIEVCTYLCSLDSPVDLHCPAVWFRHWGLQLPKLRLMESLKTFSGDTGLLVGYILVDPFVTNSSQDHFGEIALLHQFQRSSIVLRLVILWTRKSVSPPRAACGWHRRGSGHFTTGSTGCCASRLHWTISATWFKPDWPHICVVTRDRHRKSPSNMLCTQTNGG